MNGAMNGMDNGHEENAAASAAAADRFPADVGIVNMEIYFPSAYVDQTELEAFDGASAGKYTIGLGQTKMGFCADNEDVNSLCLTAVSRLVKKSGISYADIGRLEVGTETLVDKSKSVKSVLMKLFEASGNSDVEGVDSTNACYGGTAALFNSLAWVESSAWDGRYAVAVCADIAVYAKGSARPTGGAGAVAMLVGPGAALVPERGLRATHVQHVYDFYKPDMSSEYPTVDGPLSIQCYLRSLDRCYQLYCAKAAKRCKLNNNPEAAAAVSLDSFDALLFHSPFCKLVQKSLARLTLNDYVRTPEDLRPTRFPSVPEVMATVNLEDSVFNRDVEKAFMAASKETFEAKTKPTLEIATNVGNMYTPSLYGGLVSFLVSREIGDLAARRVALFSYGSGLVSSFFSLRVAADTGPNAPLTKLKRSLNDVRRRLEARTKVAPADFERTMQLRESVHHAAPYTPVAPLADLFPGTWYLAAVDEKHRREYLEHKAEAVNGHA